MYHSHDHNPRMQLTLSHFPNNQITRYNCLDKARYFPDISYGREEPRVKLTMNNPSHRTCNGVKRVSKNLAILTSYTCRCFSMIQSPDYTRTKLELHDIKGKITSHCGCSNVSIVCIVSTWIHHKLHFTAGNRMTRTTVAAIIKIQKLCAISYIRCLMTILRGRGV